MRKNASTGRFEAVRREEAEEEEGAEEERRHGLPLPIRALGRDVAAATREAKDFTLSADMISPFAGSLSERGAQLRPSQTSACV